MGDSQKVYGAISAITAKVSLDSKNSRQLLDRNNTGSNYPTEAFEAMNGASGAGSLTNEEWLDSVQAARYLKISVGSLRNMTSNGQVPHCKLGSRNRYRTEDLRQLLLSNKKGEINGY